MKRDTGIAKGRPAINLKEPGLESRLFQVLRRRREIILRTQLYHVAPHVAGRIPYVAWTNTQRFS